MQLPLPPTQFNRRVTDPVQPPWAGVLPPWAILTHVSRRSGRRYRIPILAWKSKDHIAIALWFGPHNDWVHKVLSSGSATIRRAGKELPVTNARRVNSRYLALLGVSWPVALICGAAEHTMLVDIAR